MSEPNTDSFISLADISDPDNPTVRSVIDYGGKITSLARSDDLMYVAANRAGLRILDLSNPIDPVELTIIDDLEPIKVVVDSGVMFAASESMDEIFIYDRTDPISPSLVWRLAAPESEFQDFQAHNRFLFCRNNWSNLHIYDCRNLDNIPQVVQLNLPSQSFSIFGDLLVSEPEVYDISEPWNPHRIATLPDSIYGVVIQGNRLYGQHARIRYQGQQPNDPSLYDYSITSYDINDLQSPRVLWNWYLGEYESIPPFLSLYSPKPGFLTIARGSGLDFYQDRGDGVLDPIATITHLTSSYVIDPVHDLAYVSDNHSIKIYDVSGYLEVPSNPRTLFPFSLQIAPSFPNPFNSSTTISYTLPKPGRYALDVVDIQGRLVTRLAEGWREAGSYQSILQGGELPSGTMVVRLEGAGATAVQRVELVR